MNRSLTINERLARPRLDERTSNGIPLPADEEAREDLINMIARNTWDLDTVLNISRLAHASGEVAVANFCEDLLETALRQEYKTREES